MKLFQNFIKVSQTFVIYNHKKDTSMSILDWDNEELNIRGMRTCINAELAEGQGKLHEVLWARGGNRQMITIDDDGTMSMMVDDITIRGQQSSIPQVLSELCKEGVITGMTGSHLNIDDIDVVDGTMFPANLRASYICMQKVNELKNMNIVLSGKTNRYNKFFGIYFQYSYKGVNFENTNITFEGPGIDGRQIYFDNDIFPNLDGLTSNAQTIRQYTWGAFSDIFMDNLFRKDYLCKVYDREKKASVNIPIKNLKKAVAIVNNDKRYLLEDIVLRLKDGARMDSIIPMQNFPDLQRVLIKNNNVSMMFAKEGSMFAEPWSLSRAPRNLSGMDMYEKTEDGWYVIWLKR